MVLAQVEKDIIGLANLINFYLPPFPIHWNAGYQQLVLLTPKHLCLPFGLGLVNIILSSIGSGLLLLFHFKGSLNVRFTSQDVVNHIIAAAFLGFLTLVTVIVLRHGKSTLTGYNQILKLSSQLKCTYKRQFGKMKYLQTRENKESLILLTLVLQLPLIPFIITISCVVYDLDLLHFLFEEFVLTNSVWNRTFWEIVLTQLLRFICMFHVSAESNRAFCFIEIHLIIFLASIRRFLIIVSKEMQIHRFCCLYRQFAIAYSSIRDCFNSFLMLVYQLLFLVTLLILWFISKGYGKVEMGIYVLACIWGVMLLLFDFVVLPMLSRTGVLCKKVVTSKQTFAKRRWRLRKWNLRKLEMLEVNAVYVIKPCCGNLFECNENSMVEFLTELNFRWIDAMLVFDL